VPVPTGGLDAFTPEIVLAFEAAVNDGMDVINFSGGGPEVDPSADALIDALDNVAAAGVVSLVASAVRAGIDADLRSAATALAAATLARMATDDFATLAERYEASRDGAGYRALATRARLLPGVTTSVNLPSLSITDGPSISSRRVDVVVSWQPPGAARPHRASMTTVIAR